MGVVYSCLFRNSNPTTSVRREYQRILLAIHQPITPLPRYYTYCPSTDLMTQSWEIRSKATLNRTIIESRRRR